MVLGEHPQRMAQRLEEKFMGELDICKACMIKDDPELGWNECDPKFCLGPVRQGTCEKCHKHAIVNCLNYCQACFKVLPEIQQVKMLATRNETRLKLGLPQYKEPRYKV